MEGREVGDGGRDDDECQAGVLFLGRSIAVGNVEGGGRGESFVIEEFLSGEGNGFRAGFDDGSADGGAEGGAFGVDGVEINRKVCRKGVEDGARGNGFNMGKDSGNGGAESHFFEDGIRFVRGKGREGCGGGTRAGTKSDRLGSSGGSSSDGGVGKLDHGERVREQLGEIKRY